MCGFALAGTRRQITNQHYKPDTAKHPKKKFRSVPNPFVVTTSTSFVNESQMRQTALKFQKDPRATYSVIMSSVERSLGPQAVMVYSDLLDKHHGDGNLQSAYAFSYFMAIGPLSGNYFTAKASPLVAKLRRDYLRADYYRGEAQKSTSRSPEVKLECALASFYLAQTEQKDDTGIRRTAVDDLHAVVKDAPEWADAHYWLGTILNLYLVDLSSAGGKDDPRVIPTAQEAIQELNKASQLEPQLHANSLITYAYLYQWLDQPVATLKYLSLYMQANPIKAKAPLFQSWRQHLLEETHR